MLNRNKNNKKGGFLYSLFMEMFSGSFALGVILTLDIVLIVFMLARKYL